MVALRQFTLKYPINKKKNQKGVIVKVNLEYPLDLYERDDDYLLALKIMTINFEIINKKQNTQRVYYYNVACLYSQKLVCSIVSNKHYVVLC